MKRVAHPVRRPERFLVFGQPCIEPADVAAVADSLNARWLGTGPKVARFERAIAGYKGAAHAVAVNSCTAGLHLACVALGLRPGDEVVTTALTFCATVNAIIHSGATPVLADVDPLTMNVDPRRIEAAITPRTRAILVVHFAGRPCEMDEILEIARQHGLEVVEDCAHAIETEYRGRAAGTMGVIGVLSFYATKNLTTGEGGMVLTGSEAIAARVKQLSLHGLTADAWSRFSDAGYKHYFATELGFKYNMTDLQAAIGLAQLERLERYAERRRHLWARYCEALADTPLELPAPELPGTRHARHLFTVQVDAARCGLSRDEFLELLTAHHIGAGVHYLSIAEHPYYRRTFGWRPEAWPNARRIGQQTLSLPLSGCLGDEDADDVIQAVRDILS
ncbi:MAG: DegT/DnrJ/EryC1/StrS family aminotransferase [Deltaproteobacteria bacterium]|nr:DegT/DnrJ/EryC1/StrS family aminotransferase [Deltaproteobacteria bacterium]